MTWIKPVFRYTQDLDRERFAKASCLLTVSVGQEYHEGEKFIATAELVNESFQACQLMLYDSLQRYTMALKRNEADVGQFHEQAHAEGDLWLERNNEALQLLKLTDKVIRWNDWLTHPDYLLKRAAIEKELASNVVYRTAFENTVQAYMERLLARADKAGELNRENAEKLSFEYLIEECAALCLWLETGCDFEVYPNKRNPAMDATHKLFILPNHPEKLFSVGIKFKNRKQAKPQRFYSMDNLHA